MRARRKDLDWIFSAQHERTVHNDNTITLENRVFQLDKTRWRDTLAGQTVLVHEHLDGRMSIRYGPHVIAQYASGELPLQAPKRRDTPRPLNGRADRGKNAAKKKVQEQHTHTPGLECQRCRAGYRSNGNLCCCSG